MTKGNQQRDREAINIASRIKRPKPTPTIEEQDEELHAMTLYVNSEERRMIKDEARACDMHLSAFLKRGVLAFTAQSRTARVFRKIKFEETI
jgi:hypothetical protein